MNLVRTKTRFLNDFFLKFAFSVYQVQFPSTDEGSCSPEFIINKWKYQDQIATCGFNYREPVLAQRVVMFQSAGVRARRKIENVCKFTEGIQQMILNLVTECREEGFSNLGNRYSCALQKMTLSREMKAKALIEDAQLNWNCGETEMAKHLISAVIDENTPSFTHSKALGMMGEYLADARLEETRTIFKSYLEKSLMFSANLKINDKITLGSTYYHSPEERQRLDLENKRRNYQAMAKCKGFSHILLKYLGFHAINKFISDADREYQQIAAYKKSTEFQKKLSNIQRNKEIVSDMQRRELTNDEKRTQTLLTKSYSIDEQDVKSTNKDYEYYLHLAIEYYIQSLLIESVDEMSSSAMFRLFGLWFSNLTNKEVLKEIDDHYERIPSHKFVALMPQITTHLSTDGIKEVIQKIVCKCSKS